MIITISGPPGSGKDSVANLLAEKLNFKLISMGNLRREAAKKKGMTLEEFNLWSLENSEEGDEFFDNYQKDFGLRNNNFIMVSRLGWYFIPHSIKIYIDVDERVGAERIFINKQNSDVRNEFAVYSIEEQLKLNQSRVNNDITRYHRLYKINPYNKDNYNMIIDTTDLKIVEVVEKVISKIFNK